MRHYIAALVLMAALPLSAAPAAGQGLLPFTIEGRAGLAAPVDVFASGAETGYLVEATAKLSPIPFVTVYGGWSYAEFGGESDEEVAGLDTSVRDSGPRVGGELAVPLAGLMSGVAPYLQLGVLFNRAEVTVPGDGTNTLGVESDRTQGWEMGVGARVSLVRLLALAPEVRYRSYEPHFETEPVVGIATSVKYMAASLGLTLHF